MKKKTLKNLKRPIRPDSFQNLMFFQFTTVKEAVAFSKKNNLPCMIWVKRIPITNKLFIHQKNVIFS